MEPETALQVPQPSGLQLSQESAALRQWIGEQLTIVAEAHSLKPADFSEARLRIYLENLSDMEPVDLQVAFRRCIHELTFFPKVAEIRKFAEWNRMWRECDLEQRRQEQFSQRQASALLERGCHHVQLPVNLPEAVEGTREKTDQEQATPEWAAASLRARQTLARICGRPEPTQ